jgi:hypothetical protein
MTDLEIKLIKICKNTVEAYEMLQKYRDVAMLMMTPADQCKFLQTEKMYIEAKKVLKEAGVQ